MDDRNTCFNKLILYIAIVISCCCRPNLGLAQPPTLINLIKSRPFITHIVVFGDSISDSGNNQRLNEIEGRQYITRAPVTNIDPEINQLHNTIPKKSTWITYLVTYLTTPHKLSNQQPLLWRTFTKLPAKDVIAASVNLAWASATTSNSYIDNMHKPIANNTDCHAPGIDPIHPSKGCIPGVRKQIQLYFTKFQHAHVKPDVQHGLFIIFAGGNDIFNKIENNKSTLQVSVLKSLQGKSPGQFIKRIVDAVVVTHQHHYRKLQATISVLSTPINNTLLAVKTLVKHGVPPTQVVVFNLPDLADTPLIEGQNSAQKLLVSLLGKAYNLALQAKLVAFNRVYAFRSYFDVSYFMRKILDEPQMIALEHKPNTCIKAKLGHFKAGLYISTCITQKQRHYFYVNNKHPTTYAHWLLSHTLCQRWSQRFRGLKC